MKNVVIFGATGSVGTNALSVLRAHPDDFRIVGLAAGRGGEKLGALAREFPEAAIALGQGADADAFAAFSAGADRSGRLYRGPDASLDLLADVSADIRVAAIGGTYGLKLTLAAAKRGGRLLVANKETLVSAGRLFLAAAAASGTEVLPLDSEHCAIWQCLEGRNASGISRLFLTASGGPFLDWPDERLTRATPEDATRHPVWRMGAKISVDSATLANKALEVIEAHHFFGFPFDDIEVLVHPQSAVHGMIEFVDGTLIACLGACDMRHPVSRLLFHPERKENGLPRLDLSALGRLDFARPDSGRFPLFEAGISAGRRGDRAAAFFNAANEAAVEFFLSRRLSFPGLAQTVLAAMRESADGNFSNLPEIMETHERAKNLVGKLVGNGA
ncbi:MAG: 1-deoxy-D-xylulose-5-phosphate reductoisomerase [Planctomycetota bacterium]|jgi:1-deoxy-D-xylulose-5-phosphate reductoisomerase|nr:1-deoxy-D-xylulose-5-phosphate reductoisomerase [Planctomycetota bacterium]